MTKPRRPAASRPHAAKDTKPLLRIAGPAAVMEVFRTRAERIERLYFIAELKRELGPLCVALARVHKPYRVVPADELTRIAETAMHGGVVALVTPRPIAAFDPEAARGWAKAGDHLLILDGVGNPHNLGAIARTAAFFGIKRLVLSGHKGQALPSDAAYRVARGGLEHIEFYRSADLVRELRRIDKDYRVLATALAGGRPLDALEPDARPVALILGNEEEGLPPATLAVAGNIVTIAGAGQVQSLNVAASASILIHALCSSSRRRA